MQWLSDYVYNKFGGGRLKSNAERLTHIRVGRSFLVDLQQWTKYNVEIAEQISMKCHISD